MDSDVLNKELPGVDYQKSAPGSQADLPAPVYLTSVIMPLWVPCEVIS